MQFITSLGPGEVFVFGSNESGFHGAGAAGLACRGDARNNWRQDEWFLRAMQSAVGSPERVGKWAVFGVARGYQEGREGSSYAVATVTRPGARRSVSRREIYHQLRELVQFAAEHPEKTFLVTPLGEGYAGYTRGDMREVWDFLDEVDGIPENVRFLRDVPIPEST